MGICCTIFEVCKNKSETNQTMLTPGGTDSDWKGEVIQNECL